MPVNVSEEQRVVIRRLTKQEIDRRIESVMVEVIGPPARERTAKDVCGSLGPHWITAAELVRRMQPFMVYN